MSEYKPIDECKTVAELLEDPARWTKGTHARRSDGNPAPARAMRATCFCIIGAIQRIYGPPGERLYCEVRRRITAIVCHEFNVLSTATFNDAPERTHAEVLAAVKRAGI